MTALFPHTSFLSSGSLLRSASVLLIPLLLLLLHPSGALGNPVEPSHHLAGQHAPTAFTEDFNNFDGSGFSPSPAAGQLDSDLWSVTGFSEGNCDFGDTCTSDDTDFTRGTHDGGVGEGGIYAFRVASGPDNYILGVQPTGNDFTPGDFILKATNDLGSTATIIDVKYDIWVFNDQNRANSLNFSYSTDCTTYTDVPVLDFTTEEAESSSPTWEEFLKHTQITGESLAAGATICFKWTGDDVSGGGSRDQYGIDDVSVTFAPTAITLAAFAATATPDGAVTVAWETLVERNTAGFHLYRSDDFAEQGERITEQLIAAQGQNGQGASYAFSDDPGPGTWFYWLEEVEASGATALHGPTSIALSDPTALVLDDFHGGSNGDGTGLARGAVLLAALLLLAGIVRRHVGASDDERRSASPDAPPDTASDGSAPEDTRPPYEVPRIHTYTDEELLAELGPARTGGYMNPFSGP